MSSFLEPQYELRNFLRKNLTDLNSANRSGANWIYADHPDEKITSKNVYPRVVISKITEDGDIIGLGDDMTYDEVVLQIDIVTEQKTTILTYTSTDEALGTIANSPRINFKYVPNSVSNIKHNTTAFGTVTAVNNDSSFTAPGSLSAGTVQWSRETGNLNFSSDDLTSYSGQNITSTYSLTLDPDRTVFWIGRQIVEKIRSLWRTDTEIGGLIQPKKISGPVLLPYDKATGLSRCMIEYRFNRYNTGERAVT